MKTDFDRHDGEACGWHGEACGTRGDTAHGEACSACGAVPLPNDAASSLPGLIDDIAEYHSCAFLLKVLGDTIKRTGDNSMKSDGLTHSQMGVLICLEIQDDGQCSFKDVQHFLRVSQPTTTGLISRLEQKGLVRTLSSSTDQRAKNVKLTEKGWDALETGRRKFEETKRKMESGLSEDELLSLKRCLVRMIANLSDDRDSVDLAVLREKMAADCNSEFAD